MKSKQKVVFLSYNRWKIMAYGISKKQSQKKYKWVLDLGPHCSPTLVYIRITWEDFKLNRCLGPTPDLRKSLTLGLGHTVF